MKKKTTNLILLILWMIFIFTMSSFNADSSTSQSGFIVDILNNIFHLNNIDILTIIVRKLAHITEYMVLAILMINCLKDYKINKLYLVSIIICILYSITDESHQLFIKGRSGEIKDVLIDLIGVLVGTMIYKIIINNKKAK